MDGAALVLWLLTAGAGLTMASIWLARGGLRQRDEVLEDSYLPVAEATDVPGMPAATRRSRLPVWTISTHAGLALLGFFLLAYYVNHEGHEGSGVGALPPLLVALVLLIGSLGAVMVRRWRDERVRLGGSKVPKAERSPEQRIPAAVVGLHGLLAVVTLTLVFLVAVGVGD